MKRLLQSLFLLAAAAALIAPASGQSSPQTGINRWGSYRNFVPGAVNERNLNNHLEFPIFSRTTPGRAQLNLRLTYDSQFWSQSYGAWQTPASWGWTQAQTSGAVLTVDTYNYTCGWFGDPDWPYPGDDQSGSNVTESIQLTEPDGTVVNGPSFTYVVLYGDGYGEGDDCGTSTTPVAGTYPINDGKGYSVVVDDDYHAVAYASNGDIIAGSSGAPGFTDRNGNRVYTTTSGTTVTYTDGLGTAVTRTGSGTSGSPFVYKYTGPDSTTATVTEDFEDQSIATDFGCAGHSDWSGTATVPKDLVYPDGSSYQFDYDSAGRLDKVTLPTGGIVSYSYTLDCTDLGNSSLTRSLSPGGESSWARTQEEGGGVQTVETEPADTDTTNDTVYTYSSSVNAPPTEIDWYTGSYTSGTKVKTELIAATMSGNTVTEQDVTTGMYDAAGSTALYALNKTAYDGFGNPTSVTSYDWSTSSSTPGTEVRQVTSSYTNPEDYIDQLNSVTVKDGGGTQVGKTTYSYDDYGNPITVAGYKDGSNSLSKSYTYTANGNVATATDVNSGETSYTYGDGSCGGAFPTQIKDPMNLTTSMTWYCDGGVMESKTDANSGTTTYFYADGNHTWRPTSIEDAAGNTTTITYPTATPYTAVERTMTFGSSTVDTLTTVDPMGMPLLQQRKQGPSSSTYDTVETVYDLLGRKIQETMPYEAAAGVGMVPDGTAATYTLYDPISRPLTVTSYGSSGNGTLTYAYSENDVLQTVGPAPGTENTKRKQLEYDGLGRLSSVCEVTGGTGSGTCGQTASQTGYWTKYSYNTQGQITAVSQNAQSGTPQARSYGYDQLGRLTSETNPESGTASYTFDTDGADACAGPYNGDLVKKVDANRNTICYAYDDDHRVTSISYPSGPNHSATPTKTFVYDTATVEGTGMANVEGRLAEAYTGPSGSKITDEGFSYTALGQKAAVYQSSPNSGGWYVTSQTYWANGAPETLSVPKMTPTISYGVDGEGRPETVNASSGQNPVASTTYTELGVTGVTLGSGDSDAYVYDTNTGRMKKYTFTVDGVTDVGTLSWNPNGSLGELAIADSISGTSDSQDCTYTHDDLGRLASVNCGEEGWGQTFTYDAYGNLTKSGTQSFGAAYAGNDNRISTNVDITPSYDSNGNLTSDPVTGDTGVNAYDAEGRPVTLEGIDVTYDALGRAVEAAETGGAIEFVYGPSSIEGGGKLAVMSGQTLQRAEIPLPGGGTAVYNGSGLAYYRHADHLGSSRLASTPSQTLYSSTAYAPYGEAYDEAGTEDRNYTGMSQDIDASTSGGQYDFLMREQNPVQGRWWTPDPSGTGAVDPTNPQSWNRYAYVGGTPLSSVDPLGLSPITFMFYASGNCYCAPPQKPMSTDSYLDPSEWLWELDGGGLPLIQPSQPQPGSWGGGCPLGGCPTPTPPKQPGLLSRIAAAVCSALPQGRVTSVGGSIGGIGGQNGSISTVVNYNTGQLSGFATGGLQLGWNGGAQASISTGFIYGGLGSNNSGFSGSFTTVSLSSGEGVGGFASFGNGIQVYGASAGVSLIPSPTGGISMTQTSQPFSIGSGLNNLLDDALSIARQACN